MERPHWLMAAGSLLLVVGFVGLVHKNAQAAAGADNWEGGQTAEAQIPSNPPLCPKPVIREVQQDEGLRMRTARSKFLAGRCWWDFFGFL
jgi:hypothetical protein